MKFHLTYNIGMVLFKTDPNTSRKMLGACLHSVCLFLFTFIDFLCVLHGRGILCYAPSVTSVHVINPDVPERRLFPPSVTIARDNWSTPERTGHDSRE